MFYDLASRLDNIFLNNIFRSNEDFSETGIIELKDTFYSIFIYIFFCVLVKDGTFIRNVNGN